jgi:large subunit ribosomal protein L21
MDRDGKVSVGKPIIDGVRVAAKVLAHVKDDKILVFKKKRRKGYKKMQGHRQYLSEILIQGILEKGETLKIEEAETKKTRAKKVTAKAEAEPAEEKAPEVKKTRSRKTATPAEKQTTKKVSRKKKEE